MKEYKNMNLPSAPIRVAIIGCGAVTELYYAPALRALQKSGDVQVVAVADPSAERCAALGRHFVQAATFTNTSFFEQIRPQLTIIASPVRFHLEHAREALAAGSAVLCEKPLAGSVHDAESMCRIAKEHSQLLAVGLFRRFFPALRAAKDVIENGTLGAVRSFRFSEGGAFNWPAQSPALFRRESGCGGVLIDLGIHTLDVLLWWLGQPTSFTYEDDNMGGVEANCVLKLRYPDGVEGEVRLTRDWSVPSLYEIAFERGILRWRVGEAAKLVMEVPGQGAQSHTLECGIEDGLDYNRSFTAQIKNLVNAVRGLEVLAVPAHEALPAQRLIEACYKRRTLLEMPWLSHVECENAARLARV